MSVSATVHPLADVGYVELTTFRRNGTGVPSPVWVAPAADGSGDLVVITVDDTGKTKRLAHTARVELRRCDVRGRVEAGTPTYRGEARVVRDADEVRRIRTAIVAKYGISARLLDWGQRLTAALPLPHTPRAGLVISADTQPVSPS